MIVKIKYLADKYRISNSAIYSIIDRAELSRWRYGGNGGIQFDLNDESRKVFETWVNKKRRRKNDITSRESVQPFTDIWEYN